MFGLDIWASIAAGVAALVALFGVWWKVHDSGKQAVKLEQAEKLNKIKDTTHAAQTDALTADDPRSELRKYARTDE